MTNILKSEFIKFKNTSAFKIIVSSNIVNFIVFFAIFHSDSNLSVHLRQSIFISLYFILTLLLITYSINSLYVEEKKANNFQRIITDGKYFFSWISKYFIIIITILIMDVLFIYFIKFSSEIPLNLSRYLVALSIHIVSVSILQMIFIILFQEILSIVLSFLGMIILIFSTNISMDKIWLIIPYVYGYKVYERFTYISINEYKYIAISILFMFVLYTILITANKKKFFENSHKK